MTETPEPKQLAYATTDLEHAIIYEANIRQYSAEGTFEAFTKDIPQLKELGVKVIWLMPVYPISQKNRKATGDKMAHEIEDPKEREKYLGSYYAIADYTGINPEFGTLEDFRKLVQTAHDNGMYVILDWVANHTGWDHHWMEEHPEFYTRDAEGNITDPLNHEGQPHGWDDVADLNYHVPELREAMIKEMEYWVQQEGIDGFRCDVAAEVPVDFWQAAIPRLQKDRPLFFLGELWEPQYLGEGLFDMAYGWDGHHTMNAIAKGKKNTHDWRGYMAQVNERYQDREILMNFVTNHDENSWNGTVGERMGAAKDAFIALSYCMDGMPLIYSGLEYNLDHRLKFFEKDSIPKTKADNWELLTQLGGIKTVHPALRGGKEAATYTDLLPEHDKLLIFEREYNGAKLIYLANLSADPVTTNWTVPEGWQQLAGNADLPKSGPDPYELAPWEYHILSN